ncbi:MAG: hypothetical protein R2731_09765 [Nocardioides sp.]
MISQRACLRAFDEASYDDLDRHVRRQPGPARRPRGSASIDWLRPTARSTSTPTSGISPATRWPGRATCRTHRRRARQRRRLRHRRRRPVRSVSAAGDTAEVAEALRRLAGFLG